MVLLPKDLALVSLSGTGKTLEHDYQGRVRVEPGYEEQLQWVDM
jgi:hypothetical protein